MWVDTGNTRRYTHDIEQLRLDALYLGLRTKKGFNLEDFKNHYGCDLITRKKKMLDKLQKEGFVSIQNGHLCPTPTGIAVADSVSLI